MTRMRGRPERLPIALMASFMALTGCHVEGEPADKATATPAARSSAGTPSDAVAKPKKSVIRSDIAPPPPDQAELEAVEITVTFPEQGVEPEQEALAAVEKLMAEPAFSAGGPITIWGHSDSRGSDQANLRASRQRADAVRGYLEKQGVPRQRMTVIALGESRPIAPNRNLDGSDNPEGRARNRRVQIRVEPPTSPQDEPLSTATSSEPDDDSVQNINRASGP